MIDSLPSAFSLVAHVRWLHTIMPSTRVITVRHGEAEHNVDHSALHRRDTALTARGARQAAELRQTMQALAPELVITSPTLRTLQTAAAMLGMPSTGALEPKAGGTLLRTCCAVVVAPDARENISGHECNLPCNLESAVLQGSPELQEPSMDWSPVRAAIRAAADCVVGWEAACAAEDAEPRNHGIEARCARLSSWIEHELPASVVCLVSHGDFLRRLTGGGDCMMENCEVRVFDLEGGRWTRREETYFGDAESRQCML